MRTSLIVLPTLLACRSTEDISYNEVQLPVMQLSTTSIDFGEVEWEGTASRTFSLTNNGELPMGLGSIELLDEGMENNFRLSYNRDSMLCPERDTENSETSTDTGGAQDNNTDSPSMNVIKMDRGCSLEFTVEYSPSRIGDVYAAIGITSIIDEVNTENDANAKPKFYRDPDSFYQEVIIHGYSNKGEGNIFVTPRSLNFGHYWTGESITKQISIRNIGDGDLNIMDPVMSNDCDAAFSMNLEMLDFDRKIPAGNSTLFEVTFTPEDIDAAYCTINIPSSDANTDLIPVSLQANVGTDPSNEAPTVEIISPSVGYDHKQGGPMAISLNMFDANQPADTLFCRARSMTLDIGAVDCSPDTETGLVHIEIPGEDLEVGIDTILVTITDQSELQSFASFTYLFGTDYPESDDDGDGYGDDPNSAHFDCDDSNPTVYPYAAELVDGIDNDCDTIVDERTAAADDDGDSVSEMEGDCNDNDTSTYPGAPEQPDGKDNDCDGIVDEKTSLSDDDGDGFAEVDNDCNDNNADINPSAVEYCDDIDNNCNGLRDELEEGGCIELTSEPVIIGRVKMTKRAVSVGESVTMSVQVHEADGQNLTYLWQEDSRMSGLGHVSIANPTGSTITWTAPPEFPEDVEGAIFSVYVIVTDEDGNQDWVFDEISVYANDISMVIEEPIVALPTASGCGSSSATDTSAAWLLPLIPVMGLRRYRRRQQ
ncbi:MAG: MopE-related protein [Myxococcota bacterium]|nr:MopE-related protein [Myxococcota bacterium]